MAQDTRIEGRLAGAGGLELYWQGWLPTTAPVGVVLIAHGLGEHSGRYGNVVDALVPDGWAVYGLDHRGHGRSDGRRTHLDRYADLVDDLDAFRRLVVARHPDLPVVLFGHSLGGQIATSYALRHQAALDGLVLSAPALVSNALAPAVVRVLRAVGRILPTIRVAGIDTSRISKDPEVVAAYDGDPLVDHGYPTLGLGREVYAQMDALPPRLHTLRLPVLLMHGTDDELTDPAGTRLIESTAGSPDLTVHWYDGLWHEIFNEPERERPLADLREWLRLRRP